MSLSLIFTYAIGTVVSLGLAAVAWYLPLRSSRIAKPWHCAIFVVVPLFLLGAQILKWLALRNYLDLAVWLQLCHNISLGYGPLSQLQASLYPGTEHWLSVHFTPLLYLVAGVYALIPRTETLLVVQWISMLALVYGAFRYGEWWLQSPRGGCLLALLCLLHPTFGYISLYEFEMLRFCMPFLIFAFLYLEQGRIARYAVCAAFACFVREEVALTVFCLGLYTTLFMPARRRVGAFTMIFSLVWFLFVLGVLMPMFRTGAAPHVASGWFASLGSGPSEILTTIVFRPWVFLNLIFEPVKMANIFMLLLPLGFLPLLAWPTLLLVAGNLGVNLLSSSITHTSYLLYYVSPSLPFLLVGTAKGLRILVEYMQRRRGRECQLEVQRAVLCGAFTASVFFGPLPWSMQFIFRAYKVAPFRTQNFHMSQYQTTERDARIRAFARQIPADAIVAGEQHLLPLVSNRRGMICFPQLDTATYAFFDKQRAEKTGVGTVPGSWDGFREHPQEYYDIVERDAEHWQLIAAEDGLFLYERRGEK